MTELAEEAHRAGSMDELMRCNRMLNDYSHADYPHLLEALYRSTRVAGMEVLRNAGSMRTDRAKVRRVLGGALGLFSEVRGLGAQEEPYRNLLRMHQFFKPTACRKRDKERFIRKVGREH